LAADDVERAALLERAGELAHAGNELELAVTRLEESRALYLRAGRTHDAARAAAPLCTTLWNLGRLEEALEIAGSALEVLAADEPDEDVARLEAEVARLYFFLGDVGAAMPHVEQALAIAEAQLLPEVLSQALNTKSLLLRADHHREARALVREALDVALEHDLVEAALRAYNNLAVNEWEADRREETRRTVTEGFELARQRGHRHYAVNFAGWECAFRLIEGDWDGAFALADEFFPDQPTAQSMGAAVNTWLARAALERRDDDEARRRLRLVAPEVLDTGDIQLRTTARMHEAVTSVLEGRPLDAVRPCVDWAEGELAGRDPQSACAALSFTGDIVTLEGGSYEDLQRVVTLFDDVPELKRTRLVVGELGRARGIIATYAHDEDAAADAFGVGLAAARSAGDAWLTAQLLTDYGRALVAFGRTDDAELLLDEAMELWERMGAKRWLASIAEIRGAVEVAT
jgi:tetratricopeptide (TPR) repeat protein